MFRLSTASKKLSKQLLLIAAVCQLLLPLSVSAAMQSASEGSPFYCGKLSAPMLSQLREMDLPAELLRQAIPESPASQCKACVAANLDDLLLPAVSTAEVTAFQLETHVAHPVTARLAVTYSHVQARAPPQ